jgi:hypothetical protein
MKKGDNIIIIINTNKLIIERIIRINIIPIIPPINSNNCFISSTPSVTHISRKI